MTKTIRIDMLHTVCTSSELTASCLGRQNHFQNCSVYMVLTF